VEEGLRGGGGEFWGRGFVGGEGGLAAEDIHCVSE
jgi:hypothetical protein